MKIKRVCNFCKQDYFARKNTSKFCSRICKVNSQKGKSSWCKGLTRETDPRVEKMSDSLKRYYKQNSNPKCGFKKGVKMHLGRKLTAEHKRKIGVGVKSSQKWIESIKSEKRSLKLSKALKGRKFSKKWKENISNSLKVLSDTICNPSGVYLALVIRFLEE